MASVIRIKRSSVSGNPATLAAGELAYSALTDNGSNGGDRLYIGIGTENSGNAANHFVIGGKYFTDLLDHTPGVLTATSALLVDANKKVDNLKVDNIDLNDNTISTTDANGDLVLNPNGTGKVSIANAYTLPRTDGTSGQALITNGAGTVSFTTISTILNISGDTGTDSVSLISDTLDFNGGTGIVTTVGANNVTIDVESSVVMTIGTDSGDLTPSSNKFSILGGTGINVTHAGTVATVAVENITLGTSTLTNGSTTSALAGLTQLDVDNIRVDGNTISSTDANGNIVLDPNGTGTVDVTSSRITGVAEPVNPSDAATKNYVDNAVTGLDWKMAVNLLSTANVALTGNTNTVTIDGHATLTSTHSGYRILLVGQSTAANNGIYDYTDNGTTYTLTRSADADTYQELIGTSVYVMEGTSYASTGWVQSNHYLTSFSSQNWVQFSGAGAYTAGAGLTQTGTQFDVNVAASGGIEIVSDALQLKSTLAGNGLTYSSGVLAVGGTADRITVNADTVDIASTYVGQTSITTLGTVATGTWNATTIATTKGGTGLTTYATGDILYASGANTLAKLAAGNDGKVLQMNASGVPVWGDIDGGTY